MPVGRVVLNVDNIAFGLKGDGPALTSISRPGCSPLLTLRPVLLFLVIKRGNASVCFLQIWSINH